MTTKEANDTRKGLVGKQAYKAWILYNEKNGITDKSPENLRLWDSQRNYGSLRESFGTDDDLIEIGVKQKFNSFINQYSSLKIKGGKNTSTVGFGTIRTAPDGSRLSILDANEVTRQHWVDKMKMEIQNTAVRLRAFEYEWDVIRDMVSGWLFEMEPENEMPKAS